MPQNCDGDGSTVMIEITGGASPSGICPGSLSLSMHPAYRTPSFPSPPVIHVRLIRLVSAASSSCW